MMIKVADLVQDETVQEKLPYELHVRYFVPTLGVTAVLLGSVMGSFVLTLILSMEDLRRRRHLQTFRLRLTGWEPVLMLPPGCQFSSFLSHVWSTGQDTAHNIVRQLHLLCPGIRIWLDVDHLKDVGGLEEAIGSCATVIMLLTQGYFASTNCRREIYASTDAEKPLILVHEPHEDKGGGTLAAIQDECRRETAERPYVYEHLLVTPAVARSSRGCACAPSSSSHFGSLLNKFCAIPSPTRRTCSISQRSSACK